MQDCESIKKLLGNSKFYYIICIGIDGNYLYTNDNYANTFSHVTGGFIGKSGYINMHPDDVVACKLAAEKALTNPDILVPVTIRKQDGRNGFIITQWEFRAMTENGTPTGVFCIGYDVTKYVDDLNKKDDQLKSIAFHQSHTIRKPLANIMGVVSILRKMDPEENAKHLFQILFDNATELDEVIRRIVKETES